MPQIVEVPGEGNVEFPDGMADAEIARVIRLHQPEPDAKGSSEWAAWRNQRLHDLNDAAISPQTAPTSHGYLRTLWDKINPFQILTAPGAGGGDQPGQGLIGKVIGAVVRPAAEQASQAVDAAKQGDYLSAAGHGLAAAVPIAGPMAAHFGDAAGTAIGAQMGGNPDPEATKQAVTDALAAGTMLAAPKVAAPVVDAMNAARPGAAAALRSSAETEYGRVLAPTTKANKLRTAEIVPQLIDRGVTARTLHGLQGQAQDAISRIGQAIGEKWDTLPDGTSTPLAPIYNRLQEEIEQTHSVPDAAGKLIPKGPVAARAIKNIEGLQEVLTDVAQKDPQTGELVIPVDKVRDLRQYFDNVQKAAGAFEGKSLAEQSAAAAHQLAADAIRRELGQQFPDIDALNKEYSFWKDVHQVTSDTLARRQGQAVPLAEKGAQAIGFLKGGVLGAEAVKALTAAMKSPAWGTFSAVWKDRLAKAIATGERGPAEFYASKLGAAAAGADGAILPTDGQTAKPGSTGDSPTAGAVDSGADESRNALPQPVRPGAQAAGGARTSIDVPGEARTYAGRYEVRDLADVQPSHLGATFQPNPKYAIRNDRNYDTPVNQAKIVDWSAQGATGFKPANLINDAPDSSAGPPVIDSDGNVLGGNGRTMILQRVYKGNPPGSQAYRQLLEQKAAQFGIDPASYAHLKQPVLVRVIDDAEFGKPGSKQNAVTDFNKTGTAALTPSERSIADSRRVSAATLDDIAQRLEDRGPEATLAQVMEGKGGIQILSQLVSDGVISPQERASLVTEQGLTKAGRERISSLMLGRFFSDPAQMDRLPASLRNKMERLAAPLARTEGSGGFDLAPHVRTALDLLEDAGTHQAGSTHTAATLEDHIAQSGLFGEQKYSPEAVALAKLLATMKPVDLTNAVRHYAEQVKYAREYQGPGMFGNFPDPPTPRQAFNTAFGAALPEK